MSNSSQSDRFEPHSSLMELVLAIDSYNNQGHLAETEAEAVRVAEEVSKKLEALGLTTATEKEGEEPARLHIEITDESKLLSYLRGLDVAELKKEGMKHWRMAEWNMCQITRILIEQIDRHYELEAAEDKDNFNNFNAIVFEFNRLGLDSEAKVIQNTLANSTRRTLREFIDLSRAQCFNDGSSSHINPTTWHEAPKFIDFFNKWEKAIKAIENAAKNPQATRMCLEATDNLINLGRIAINDMKNANPVSKYHSHITATEDYIKQLTALKRKIYSNETEAESY